MSRVLNRGISALVIEDDKAAGPALGDDLIAAGLNDGVCFEVRGDKTIFVLSGVAKARRAAIEAVLANHDPRKPKAVPVDV